MRPAAHSKLNFQFHGQVTADARGGAAKRSGSLRLGDYSGVGSPDRKEPGVLS